MKNDTLPELGQLSEPDHHIDYDPADSGVFSYEWAAIKLPIQSFCTDAAWVWRNTIIQHLSGMVRGISLVSCED